MRIIQVTPKELKELISEVLDVKINELSESKLGKLKVDYLSRKETKELLGVSYVTLNNWHNKGILVPKYIGKKLFYDKQEIVNRLSKNN